MMRIDPSLRIVRLKLFAQGRCIYDQFFKAGINIIRSSKNSCGKSTILDSIYYVLGGEIFEWNTAAQQIDFGTLEVEINGRVVTLKRDFEDGGRPAISVFEGTTADSEKDSISWMKYGIQRTGTSKSITQIIFEMLGYPQSKTKSDDNITLAQVLRLIYCDQDTSASQIFKFVKFDQENMRIALAELLLGVDDFELFSLRSEASQLKKQLDEVRSSIRSLKTTSKLMYDFENFEVSFFENQILVAQNRVNELKSQISAISSNEREVRVNARKKETKNLELNIESKKGERSEKKNRSIALALEISDSTDFVDALKERSNALSTAIAVKEHFGTLDFQFCPLCLNPVDSDDSDINTCGLCKATSDPTGRSFNRLKAKSEIDFQIAESIDLLKDRQAEKEKLDFEVQIIEAELKKLERQYSEFIRLPSFADQEIYQKLIEVGSLEKEVESLIKSRRVASYLMQKIEDEGLIGGKINSTNEKIKLISERREQRWTNAVTYMEEAIGVMLKKDGGEKAFLDPKTVEIQFDKNKVFVNGASKFSASSGVVLKNTFYLALLAFSISGKEESRSSRFPKLLLLDNIEDKGMTAERSQNFQRVIVELSESATIQHQIIFTTSMIAAELDNPKYCVGPVYTLENRTLDLDDTAITS